jgi:hypothetical protein
VQTPSSHTTVIGPGEGTPPARRQPRLGRLGRLLVPEVEAYLEFYAIARGYDVESTRGRLRT